jgi:hypothetical protein
MLEFLRDCGRASERKLRLFAVACCRRLWPLLTDKRSRRGVRTAERYADGRASTDELRTAERDVRVLAGERFSQAGAPALQELAAAAAVHSSGFEAANRVIGPATRAGQDLFGGVERLVQAELLRDLLGPLPFRDVRLEPEWLAGAGRAAVLQARTIYGERSLDRLPRLATYLEDAGCTDAKLLVHLRGPGPHVRGCWAVDAVLGKA